MFNPNYIYCIVFLFVLGLYQLGWSELYPPLSNSILVFLLATVVVNLFFGLVLSKLKILNINKGSVTAKGRNILLVTLILLVVSGIDKIMGDIPTLHIVLITFTSFYNVYVFSRFLLERKTYLFVIFLILFLSGIFLSTYRILIFYNLITCLLTYIYIRNPFKSFKGKLIISSCALGVVFIFGYLGNNLKGDSYNSGELILTIGEANDKFRNSVVPNEFFWTYLYASSPLANLELNISNRNSMEPSVRGYVLWLSSEFLPDFISEKIFVNMNESQIAGLQVNDALNVSTVYLRSYRYASWLGLSIMALYIAIFPTIYLFLIRNSRFFIPGLVSILTIYMFLIFDNMFAFSALSFQLIYPLLGLIKLNNRENGNEEG